MCSLQCIQGYFIASSRSGTFWPACLVYSHFWSVSGLTVRVQELFLPQRSSEVRYWECRLAPSLRLAANRFALLACDLRAWSSVSHFMLTTPLKYQLSLQLFVHGWLLAFLGWTCLRPVNDKHDQNFAVKPVALMIKSVEFCVSKIYIRVSLLSDLDWFWSSKRQNNCSHISRWTQLYLILHQSCFSLKSDHQDLYFLCSSAEEWSSSHLLRSVYFFISRSASHYMSGSCTSHLTKTYYWRYWVTADIYGFLL